MQSGQQTLAGIEEALRDLKTQTASITSELEAANRERVGLVAERLAALRRLAAIRGRRTTVAAMPSRLHRVKP